MNAMMICVLTMVLTSLLTALLACCFAQYCELADQQSLVAFATVIVGCPTGLWCGLRLASLRRDQVVSRLADAERSLISLSLISVLGLIVGLLGEGRGLSATLGVISTVGSAAVMIGILLRTPRKGPRRRR